jgi:hypothetical protein
MSQHPATRLVRSALTSRWLLGILMALGAVFGAVLDPVSHGTVEGLRSGTRGKPADKER